MNQRDQELLDKQLWRVDAVPPGHGSALGLAFVAVFLGGLSLGAILFAPQSKQMQTTSREAATVFSFLDSSPQH
jgi:hypothetical protein